jgi:hypothetical protein
MPTTETTTGGRGEDRNLLHLGTCIGHGLLPGTHLGWFVDVFALSQQPLYLCTATPATKTASERERERERGKDKRGEVRAREIHQRQGLIFRRHCKSEGERCPTCDMHRAAGRWRAPRRGRTVSSQPSLPTFRTQDLQQTKSPPVRRACLKEACRLCSTSGGAELYSLLLWISPLLVLLTTPLPRDPPLSLALAPQTRPLA